MQRQHDSNNRQYFRSDRIFTVNTQWFFMTRETTQEGPFRSLFDAKQALTQYTDLMTSGLGQFVDKRFQDLRLQQVKPI